MVDISFVSKIPYIGYIYLGIVGVVTLLSIIINTAHGIIRDLFKVGYYVILYFMFVYLYPLGQNLLSGVAFIASKPTLSMILVGAVIVIVWLLLRKILYAIFKKLFKKEKAISKFLGFLFSLPVTLIFNILLVNLLDPFLVAGTTVIASDPYVAIYNNVVMQPIQDACYNVNIPTSLETILINKGIEDKEERNKAYNDFKSVKNFIIKGSSYLETLETDEEFATSYITVLSVLKELNNEKLNTTLGSYTTSYIEACEGKTIHLGSYLETFENLIVSTGITAETLLNAQQIFVE